MDSLEELRRSLHSHGFVKIPRLLNQQRLLQVRGEIDDVHETISVHKTKRRDTYAQAFDRTMNLWRRSETVKHLAVDETLASLAAQMLSVSKLRLSHDQSLYKLPNAPETPIHADQYHWPISGENALTAWIPLQDVPMGMGELTFYKGSHLLEEEARLTVERMGPAEQREYFERSPFPQVSVPCSLGDVSFHLGWVFHKASTNSTDSTRAAYTLIYIDGEAQLVAPHDGAPIHLVTKDWCPGCKIGGTVSSHLNPQVYP